MKFQKNILAQKSNAKTVVGILDILVIALWISIKMYIGEQLNTFDTVNLIILFIIGVLFIIAGRGIPITRLFGKAFFLIDEEKIDLKISVFNKKETIRWNEIKSIEYKKNTFLFTKKDQSIVCIKLKPLSHRINKRILRSIITIGKHKNLKVKRMRAERMKDLKKTNA